MTLRWQPSGINNLSPMRAAWLAALIDGEGTIAVRQNRSRSGHIHIYNTNRAILERCKDVVGGGIVTIKPHFQTNLAVRQTMPCHQWSLAKSEEVYLLLCQLYPYLIIKQLKAMRVITRFCHNSLTRPPLPLDSPSMREFKLAQGHMTDREFAHKLGLPRRESVSNIHRTTSKGPSAHIMRIVRAKDWPMPLLWR